MSRCGAAQRRCYGLLRIPADYGAVANICVTLSFYCNEPPRLLGQPGLKGGLLNAAHLLLSNLCREPDPRRQRQLRHGLGQLPNFKLVDLVEVLRHNPFFEMDDEDLKRIDASQRAAGGQRRDDWMLMRIRQAAAGMSGRRIGIFAMPKSGSSFISTAIAHALQISSLGLMSVAADAGQAASFFGINGREQELDELAIVMQTVRGGGSWVAQHHSRFTPYSGQQLRFFGIQPIVTTRNIFDAIVSMDDMIAAERSEGQWWGDPYTLPLDYHRREQRDRLAILCREFGRWLINFHLSWIRGRRLGIVDPLVLNYEEDVLAPERLASRIAEHLGMDEAERARLEAYVQAPDRAAGRFNKGVAGRGSIIAEVDRDLLIDHARLFGDELGNAGIATLFGRQ